ncbi:unnamed protein product [Orchesella dallaii]|uniref:Uncharacterized protein n=1 Tax=Orchesella dallaii TaxID=48710 RepID=A0ABP1RIF8_9HEXA
MHDSLKAKDSLISHGAFSAPSTSAALVESENRKRTQLGEKSSNAVSQQPTPPTTSYPPPRLGLKNNDAS